MAISYSFVDNKLYGTDDINNITKNLVGGGVAPFPTKDSYSLSDLNSLTSALVESGVCCDGLRCSISGGSVTVSEGILYFENGVCLTVDEEGYEIEITSETKGYVCAHFDDASQEADIKFCTDIPQSGFYVLLAEISADGIVSDKRNFARSKVGTLGTNCSVLFIPTEENNYRYKGDLSRFNYALLLGKEKNAETNLFYGVYNLKEQKFEYVIRAAKSGTAPYYKGYVTDSTTGLIVSVTNGELYVSETGTQVLLV